MEMLCSLGRHHFGFPAHCGVRVAHGQEQGEQAVIIAVFRVDEIAVEQVDAGVDFRQDLFVMPARCFYVWCRRRICANNSAGPTLIMIIFKQGKKLSQLALLLCLVWIGGCGPSEKGGNMIALITDFGSQDPYVAQMKGAILAIDPAARIVDINHDLDDYDLWQASYFLNKAARYYPAGTIFVVVTDPGVGGERKPIALRTNDGKILVGPDNGVFSHVMDSCGVDAAYLLDNPKYFRAPDVSNTFHGRDIFGPVAAHLALGVSLEKIGSPLKQVTRLKIDTASRLARKITGKVVYVDHYGNVITNILPEHFDQEVGGHLVKVTLNGKTFSVPMVKSYAEGPENRLFALFNSDGELELAMNQKSASDTLKAKVGAGIILTY
jgi:S-adenosylmethionine hydrolase